jgi:hypothetical protein
MKHRSAAGLAGLVLALLLAAPAAAAPGNVHIRVEGSAATLVPRTAVTTTNATVNKDGQAGHDCTGTSAAGALEQVTRGDWTGVWFGGGLGYGPTRILTETHDAATSSYWSVWRDYKFSDAGICALELQTGDDVMLVADCYATPTCAAKPLRLTRVPALAAPGSTASVLVERLEAVSRYPDPSETNATPAAGATVTAGGQTFTTNASGIAQITYAGRGPVAVQATMPGTVRSTAEQTCVTDGSDGACSTVRPSAPDRTAPTAALKGIRDGQRFKRRRAPRELSGTVSEDPSGLWAVKIRLTRRHAGKCWYFSGSREQFLKRTCGKQYAFKVGDRAEWSYLLPARLPRGRYVLSTYAIDNAFNRGAENRVVFRVR